jgi:hypothetical protein
MENPTNLETKKAALQLAGLIYGVSLDGVIDRNEFHALKSWCAEFEPLCEQQGFQQLHSKINPIIQDGKVNAEEIEDIKVIINEFLDDLGARKGVAANLYFLNGIFKGILASGVVNTYEMYKLNQWLEKNDHLKTSAPFDEVFSLIQEVLEDKKVDNEESVKLKAYFNTLTDSYLVIHPMEGLC